MRCVGVDVGVDIVICVYGGVVVGFTIVVGVGAYIAVRVLMMVLYMLCC